MIVYRQQPPPRLPTNALFSCPEDDLGKCSTVGIHPGPPWIQLSVVIHILIRPQTNLLDYVQIPETHHRRRADFPLFFTTLFFFFLRLLPSFITTSTGSCPAKKKPPGITRAVLCAISSYKDTSAFVSSLLREVPCLLPRDCHNSFSHRLTAGPPVPTPSRQSRALHLGWPLIALTIARFLDTIDDRGCSTPKAVLTRGGALWQCKVVQTGSGARAAFF